MNIQSIFLQIRSELGISQRQLAKEINICQASIADYETGKRRPGFLVTQKVFRFIKKHKLKIKMDNFFKGDMNEENDGS